LEFELKMLLLICGTGRDADDRGMIWGMVDAIPFVFFASAPVFPGHLTGFSKRAKQIISTNIPGSGAGAPDKLCRAKRDRLRKSWL
jgi:hypothetical protein